VFAQDSKIGLLLDALVDGDQLARRPVGHRSTVFLDYDGTLTPIVDRAEDALISVSGSVARHYRLIGKSERVRIVGGVDALLADHATELKVAPGKVVYEIQPGVDGDKGSAVLCLLEVVGLDGDEVVPLYPCGDIADEHAFDARGSRSVGTLVAGDGDPELGARCTAAAVTLRSRDEVERFRRGLAQEET
jgi:trehalose-6-phosphatase